MAREETPEQREQRLVKKRASEKLRRQRPDVQAYYIEKNKNWRAENKERYNGAALALNHKKRANDPAKYLWSRAKIRAMSQGVPFSITVDDVVVPELCPALGMPLVLNTGHGKNADSMSLDKIVPELGYVPGNVQVISRRANLMKNDASWDELELFARWINSSRPVTPIDADTHGTVV